MAGRVHHRLSYFPQRAEALFSQQMDSGDDLGFFYCRVETRYSQPVFLSGRRLLVTARSTRNTQRPIASARMHHSA